MSSVGPVALASFKAAIRITDLRPCIQRVDDPSPPINFVKRRLLEQVGKDKIPLHDPIPLVPRFLNKYLKDTEPHIPQDEIYTCIVYNNGEVGFTGGGTVEHRFISAPDFPIDFKYLEHTDKHPLLVDLTGALLTVYDPELKAGESILPEHFIEGKVREANEAIFRYMQNGGVTDERAKNLFAIATGMDTSCKPPDFPKDSFEMGARFYAEYGYRSKLFMGAGLEYLLDYLKEEKGISLEVKDYNKAIANGIVSEDDYVDYRQDAIKFIRGLDSKINPIVTASPMQNGLSESRNIKILSQIAHDFYKTIPNLVLHRLGSPFLDTTDWHTPEVTEVVARQYAGGVKTSPPDIFSQLREDYPSIKNSGTEMLTGDDKNFALIWLWGAMRQLEERKKRGTDLIYERNGFHFIKGANIHGLLGNTGLAPERMIAGIIELSKWYHAKVKNKSNADKHLSNYLEIMLPYTAMSFYSFFGPYRYTPSYPQGIEATHVFAGVHDRKNGIVPPHRRANEKKHQSQLYDGGLLALYALARAQGPEQIAEIVKRNPNDIIIPA